MIRQLISALALLLLGLASPAWADTIIVSDTFTEAADTDLASHTPDTGTSWTEVVDTCAPGFIEVKTATGDITSDANEVDCRLVYTAAPSPSTADVTVEWVLNNAAGGAAQATTLIARYQDATHWYGLLAYTSIGGATNLRLIVANGTVPTTATGDLGTATVGFSAGRIIRFSLIGSTLKAIYCTPTCTDVITVTDSTITTAGATGFAYGNVRISTDDPSTGARFDNFIVTEISSAATCRSLVGGCLVNGGLVR